MYPGLCGRSGRHGSAQTDKVPASLAGGDTKSWTRADQTIRNLTQGHVIKAKGDQQMLFRQMGTGRTESSPCG